MRKLIIIPTYNERENMPLIIEKVFSLPEDFDILVVDDASPDGTAGIVKQWQNDHPALTGTPPQEGNYNHGTSRHSSTGVKLPSQKLNLIEREGKLGLGSAYIAGFRWALEHGYDWIFEMDADFSHNPDDLMRLYRTALEGADMVIGSRYVKGVNVVNWPMSRLLMSWFASRFVRWVTRMPVRDATAGFVCYSREVLERIDLDAVRMKGYGFQIEMKYTAWKLGFNVREVSIVFVDRTLGESKMSSGIFSEAFWGVLGLRFRKIKGRK